MEIELKDQKKNIVAVALVSHEDYENVNKYKWHAFRVNGNIMYAKGVIDKRMMFMHQFIMSNQKKTGMVIDHKNNNGLDNRRENLHYVTYGANNQNRKKLQSTKNKYIGVKPWKGSFAVDQGGIRLGTFANEEEAARHYDKYVTIKYKGGSPKTNFHVASQDIEGLTLENLVLCKRKGRDLPLHISLCKKTQKYIARRVYQGILYSSASIDTLEEAVAELDKINSTIKNLNDAVLKTHYEKTITRNANNEAVILITRQEDTCLECIVDDVYWHDLMLHNWWMNGSYVWTTIDKKRISMHSYLIGKKNQNFELIDHINKNTLDNRITNLRSVSHTVNAHNKNKKPSCSSTFIGVSKRGLKWHASISHNNVRRYIGTFETEIEAAEAYNKKASELYGENANLNIL